MSEETLYELYFAQVAGHIIDVRDITHIGPTEQNLSWESISDDEGINTYGDVPAGYRFEYAMKGTGEYQTFNVIVTTEEEAVQARDVLVVAHAKLWLPYPDATADAVMEATDEMSPEEVTEAINAIAETVPTVQESNTDLGNAGEGTTNV